MVETTADTAKASGNKEEAGKPIRTRRDRSASTPRKSGSKSGSKMPIRRTRERSKSLGPGSRLRRTKYDKASPRSSPEKKRKPTEQRGEETSTPELKKGFRTTKNKIMVPDWNKEMKGEKTSQTEGAESMEIDGEGEPNREVKIKREQINARAGEKVIQKKIQAKITETLYSDVEITEVKSPEQQRKKEEVIDLEEEEESVSKGEALTKEETTKTETRETKQPAEGGSGELKTNAAPQSQNDGEEGRNGEKIIENPYKKKDTRQVEIAEKEEEEASMPKKKNQANKEASWASKVKKKSPQKVIKTHEKTKYQEEMLGEISFLWGGTVTTSSQQSKHRSSEKC